MAKVNNPQIPARLSQIDDVTRPDHFFINPDDVCFHLWDYVTNGDVKEHPTNQLISNLKIRVEVRNSNPYRWRYKLPAIEYAAAALSQTVPQDFVQHFTWVPIPPSAPQGTPEYDPRLIAVLRRVVPSIPDLRELLIQTVRRTSREKGLQPHHRAADLQVVEQLADPTPLRIMLFDDVLTTGSHFKAAQAILQARFPNVYIGGVFLARVRRPEDTTSLPNITLPASWSRC